MNQLGAKINYVLKMKKLEDIKGRNIGGKVEQEELETFNDEVISEFGQAVNQCFKKEPTCKKISFLLLSCLAFIISRTQNFGVEDEHNIFRKELTRSYLIFLKIPKDPNKSQS